MVERIDRKYSVEGVLEWVEENIDSDENKRVMFDGHRMKPYSKRYLTFMKGVVCECGTEGTHFYKERSQPKKKAKYNPNEPWHFNLYGYNKHGHEILMTKDHIIAKSNGGSNEVSNLITMCTKCNGKKGSMTPDEWEDRKQKIKEKNVKPKSKMIKIERKQYERLIKYQKSHSKTVKYFISKCNQLESQLNKEGNHGNRRKSEGEYEKEFHTS